MTTSDDSPAVGVLGLVRFVSELAMLAGLVVVGLGLAPGSWVGWVLAVIFPVVAAGLWGAFVGPKAERRLDDPVRFGLEVVLFAATVAGLLWTGHALYAGIVGVLYAVGAVHGRRGG